MSVVDFDSICALSSLKLNDNEKDAFSGQFENILKTIDVLKNVTEKAGAEFAWPLKSDGVTRDDLAQPFQHDLIHENAPSYTKDGFLVPRISS